MAIDPQVQLPNSVTAADGDGGLPVLRVRGARATGEVYLHGGHVTAWTPAGHDPVLWMSQASRFEPGTPIRGGVPVCFPWFGPGRSGNLAPAHGLARVAEWTLVDVIDDGTDVTLVLRLTDDDVRHQPGSGQWPHAFEALYHVTFGAELKLALTVRNTGEEEISFEEALHTYLAVDDIHGVSVTGLEGATYLDKLAGETHTQDGAVTVSGETDRVYRSAGTAVVADGHRRIVVAKEGSADTVVWNPWTAKAAAMADYGDDEWRGMVCVETANVLDDAVTLPAGQRQVMRARITVEA